MIKCKCGNQLPEESPSTNSSAILISESTENLMHEFLCNKIEELVLQYKANKLKEWSSKNLSFPSQDLCLKDKISDFLTKTFCNYQDYVLECSKCGSIWVVKSEFDDEYFLYEKKSNKLICN